MEAKNKNEKHNLMTSFPDAKKPKSDDEVVWWDSGTSQETILGCIWKREACTHNFDHQHQWFNFVTNPSPDYQETLRNCIYKWRDLTTTMKKVFAVCYKRNQKKKENEEKYEIIWDALLGKMQGRADCEYFLLEQPYHFNEPYAGFSYETTNLAEMIRWIAISEHYVPLVRWSRSAPDDFPYLEIGKKK